MRTLVRKSQGKNVAFFSAFRLIVVEGGSVKVGLTVYTEQNTVFRDLFLKRKLCHTFPEFCMENRGSIIAIFDPIKIWIN